VTDPIAYLESLLRSRLRLTEARQIRVRAGGGTRDGVVPTPRLLLIRTGVIRYTIEQHVHRITAPAMLLIPTHARRAWTAERAAHVLFFSFETRPTAPLASSFLVTGRAAKDQTDPMTQLLALFTQPAPAPLRAEAEAKAILARFLTQAAPLAPPQDAARTATPATSGVEHAIRWLHDNLAHPDPLPLLPAHAGLSPAYFRSAFRKLTGAAPRDHLNHLRMHAARFHLAETTLSVKQIARLVGFTDPLYFSRRYHRFWQRWPTDERDDAAPRPSKSSPIPSHISSA
jgi:AraC-like DNA-binding protein